MGELKQAWELASERIIASRHRKDSEAESKPQRNFIPVPEFDDREDKTLNIVGYNENKSQAKETQLIENPEEVREKIEKEQMSQVKIQDSETIHTDEIKECIFCGSTKNFSGYSKMNRNIVFGLSNRNIRVKVEDDSGYVEVNKETDKQLTVLQNIDVSSKAPKIYSMTVPSNVTHAGKKIAYTMIESSSLHKDYCEKLKLMDEIWVPSVYGKNLLRKNNISSPIYVMPLGVDVERYTPNNGIMNFGSTMRSFKFLCVSKYSHRKGFDVLLRAFMEEFDNDEDVSLLLVTRPIGNGNKNPDMQILMDDFNAIKQSIKKFDKELPHIAVYNKPITERDMPKVYASCNAFALISRGEGFSLCTLEAASCGLPVIASNVTAHTDYLKEDNSYLVEADGYIEARMNGNLSRMAKLCHFYEGQLFPDFNESTVNQTRTQMRRVFENYSEAQEKAEKLRNIVMNNYTWNMSIDKIHSRIGEL
jgi:glycosyltransferase involved in cell wall biosynthesis